MGLAWLWTGWCMYKRGRYVSVSWDETLPNHQPHPLSPHDPIGSYATKSLLSCTAKDALPQLVHSFLLCVSSLFFSLSAASFYENKFQIDLHLYFMGHCSFTWRLAAIYKVLIPSTAAHTYILDSLRCNSELVSSSSSIKYIKDKPSEIQERKCHFLYGQGFLIFLFSAQLKEIEKWPNDGSLAGRLINCILLPCSPFLCALVFPLFWMYWILNLCHVMSTLECSPKTQGF